MRIIVFFDLPVITAKSRRDYYNFRKYLIKYLIKSGFVMMQESVYCKLVQNSTMADAYINNIKQNRPPAGLVQLLKVTEKQYAKMEYIVGRGKSNILDTDERLVEIWI